VWLAPETKHLSLEELNTAENSSTRLMNSRHNEPAVEG